MSAPEAIQTLLNIVQRLLGRNQAPVESESFVERQPAATITRNVSLMILDPLITTQGSRRLSQVMGWNVSERLIEEFLSDLREVSHGVANFQIAERILVNHFPVKADGFAYTGEVYLRCWRRGSGFHQPDAIDYENLLFEYQIPDKVRRGSIDEVWTIGFPYAGFFESRMAGPDAFWCNAPPVENSQQSGRRYVIMAFNYERGIGEMLEAMGHRAESILEHAFRRVSNASNLYKRFTRHQKTHPGQAEVGTVHFAPNSRQDYDWGNPTPVQTTCRNWKNFPDLSGAPVILDCREWGNGDIRAHHKWWFSLIPHVPGSANGVAYNWWEYILDPNAVR